MTDTPTQIKKCMAASLESPFQIMGSDRPSIRHSNVSIEKYSKLIVSHYQTQLCVDIDTRNILVTLPETKRTPLLTLLRHWHSHRKIFVIKEASSLLGKLNHAAEVASWARFLFIQIRSSLLHCMRKNKKLTMKRSHFKYIIADAQDLADNSISILKRKICS